MADDSTFGGGSVPGTMAGGNTEFGGGLSSFGGSDAGVDGGELPVNAQPAEGALPAAPKSEGWGANSWGSGIAKLMGGLSYKAADPELSPLDQTADTLQQRIKRANDISANPLLQVFSPEGVQRARDFVPAATEKLQQIRTQQAAIKAGRQQAETLGLAPGEVADEATMADRVEFAKARALKGDLRSFKGLQAVDPKAAEAIQDQVQEVAAGHLSKAQFAFDKLSSMRNQGEYTAAVQSLRDDGTLTSLEGLGLKVPPTFQGFNDVKAKEGMALREARIGIDTVRNKLEQRNTFQGLDNKASEAFDGRLATSYGDKLTGKWGVRQSDGTYGLVVNGAADPRDLGKKFVLASPEQRKAIGEEATAAVPKAELEKARAFDRTFELAKPTAEQAKRGDVINTNPNVQQALAEQLASMLRGGTGGANVGLLQIETSKRGAVQGLLDSITAGYAGGINTITGKDVRGYMTKLTQDQIREVVDGIKAHNDELLEDRVAPIARRAGALGLDTTTFGWGKDEAAGVIGNAVEQGRQEQVARMTPYHRAIGGGDGAFLLGAQRPGADAVAAPPGTQPTTQIPGAPPVATPVQQAQNPAQPNPAPTSAQSGGPGAPPVAPAAPPPTSGPGPAGGGLPPAPVTIAGQTVNVALPPGASPEYLSKTQRIESGNKKDPWTATTGNGPDGKPLSSASGAWQFISSTWAADKPPGAPDRAADATPQQQAEAAATRATKNATALGKRGIPVNDTTLYIAHNLGEGAGPKLITADPNADARSIVGEVAARNNPKFFKGRPTVATVLERYTAEVEKAPDDGPKPKPGAGGATAEAPPSFLQRVSRVLSQGVAGGPEAKDKAVADVGNAAVEHAPAIGSTLGAVGGSVAGPIGTVGGGAAGGAAGQSFKDWMQGRDQNPAAIAKEAALGGVLGVGTAARPVVSAVARAGGAGAVEAGAAAAEGKDTADVIDAGGKGAAAGAIGETFGRALGMVGHKVWNMFAPDAKKAVQTAAGKYADAEAALATEAKTLPGVGGAAGGPNPKYEAAEKARTEAERTLKDAGLKPEEAAYAHKVSSEGVPRQEAEVTRPGALEKETLGKGYQRLEQAVDETGKGAVKATPKLVDGPRAAVENKQVSSKYAELAERAEAAITAPAPSWGVKWQQLQAERSKLLQAERDALSSTAPGRTKIAEDMRLLADSVRKQQEKAAKYVFGDKDGEKFMGYMKTLDVRYRRLMDATNGGDIAAAAAMKGEAGRDAEKKFIAFAHDDPVAQRAYRAIRGVKGDAADATVPWMIALEGAPVVGKVVKVAKLGSLLKDWARERAAGSPVKFSDLVQTNLGAAGVNQSVRDLAGTAGARGATMGGEQQQ